MIFLFKYLNKLNLLIYFLILNIQKIKSVENNDLAKICKPVNRPLDLLFLLDGSGSVGGNTFQTQMQILDKLIDILQIGPGQNQSQLAVMQYATYSFVEFPFNAHRNKSQLRQAIQRIRHKSGTTKTGKALEKALQLYKDRSSGARLNNVAKVIVVVSDGRSQDDPVPTAVRLRQSGAYLISLGIGSHVNLAELLQMSGDSEMVFDEQTEDKSIERFTNLFKRLSTAEACEFVRGGNGADIHCESSFIEVLTTTKTKFNGIFYVQGHWLEKECLGIINENEGNGTELILRIPLGKCGLERQFSSNPKGYYFRGSAILQFNPNFRTGIDKIWKILCFYRDHSSIETGKGGGEDNEIEWQLIKENNNNKRKDYNSQLNQMPCNYRLFASEHLEQMARPSTTWGGGGGNNAANNIAECLTKTNPIILGQNVIHSWECNSDNFDVYQSFLINSCFLEPSKIDETMSSPQMLIDKNGCSTDQTIIETPQYVNQLKAFSKGIAIKNIGNETTLRLRCNLKFCDRLMGECEDILPPKCGLNELNEKIIKNDEENNINENNSNNDTNILNNTIINRRRRKQSGFPVLIRPLNGDGPPPPLVMFTKSSSKRKRPTLSTSSIQIDKRNYNIINKNELFKEDKEENNKPPLIINTVKTILENNKKEIKKEETTTIKILNEFNDDSKKSITTTTISTSTTLLPTTKIEEINNIKNKKINNHHRNEIISTEEITGKLDPFQEENEIIKNDGDLNNKEEIILDQEILNGLNENEMIVISQQVEIRENEEQEGGGGGGNNNEQQCNRKKRTIMMTLNGEGKL